MKNRAWSLLAALVLLVAVLVFSVSAETTEPVCPHCNVALSQINWATWAGTAGDFNTSGHYRLPEGGLEQSGQVKITGGDVVLDLAGCQLSTASNRPIYVNGGTMTILDTVGGAVVKGKATASGSTLFVNANGTLHIYGGTYESAATTGKDGGTISVSGNVTLHNGTIKGSTSTTAGGCLQLTKGSFTMNGGLLTAGTATTSGGTIFAKAGTLNLNGGTIEAGTVGSGKSGTSVFAYTAATTAPCTVNIGGVSVPNASKNSFVIGTNTTVNISGAPKIGCLNSTSALTVGQLTDGASVYLAVTDRAALTQVNAQLADYLAKGYLKAYTAGKVLTTEDGQTMVIADYDCPCCDATDITWKAWNGTMEDGGHYYLSNDQELTKVINVAAANTITLDLKGKTIHNASGRAFLVYGNLNLVDSGKTGKVISGSIESNGGVFSVQADANVTLYGGAYVGTAAPAKGSVAYVLGNLTIHEGVTLDGSVAQDTAKTCSTVYINKGHFTMDGGKILGAAAKRGGSIFVEAGSLTLDGGQISGGVAHATEGSGDDIYVLAANTVTIGGCQVANEFHINAAEQITVSGAPVLGKLKLSDGVLLTLGQLTEGASVTVAANGAFTVANDNAADYLATGYILSNTADRTIVAVDGVLKAIGNDGPRCPHCDQLMELISWQSFNAAAVKDNGGHYYLTGAVNRTIQLQISAGVDSVIDLRGNNFTVTSGTARAFLVYGTLSVMDTEGEGTVTGKGNGNGGTYNVQAGGSLNLYSGIAAGSTATSGGAIYTEGTVNISGGTVRAGVANRGGNIYAGNGAQVTISGGIIGGGQAVADADGKQGLGGNLYVAAGANVTFSAGNLQNGKSDNYGGNVAVAADGEMVVTGGNFRSGAANLGGSLINFRGDNLYLEGTVTMYKGYFAVENTDMPGNAILARGTATLNLMGEKKDYSDVMNGQVHVLSTCTMNAEFGGLIVCRYGRFNWYKTLDAAIADFGSWENHRAVKVLHPQDIAVDKDIHLDVNGMALNVTVAEGCTLYAVDSSATVEASGTGSVTLLGEGTLAMETNNGTLGHYIALTKDGVSTFHKLEMQITKVTLRTAAMGFYYKAVYACDPVLAPMIESYGIVLSVNNMPGADFMTETGDINSYTVYSGDTFQNGVEVTSGSVFNIMKKNLSAAANQKRGEMKIYANVYVVLNLNGEKQTIVADSTNAGLTADSEEFSGVAYSLFDVMQLVNEQYPTMEETEQAAVKAFYETWYNKGMGDWALPGLSSLVVGFGRVDITPDFPVYISGGNVPNRISTEVKDPIYITCIAISDAQGNTALIITQDLLSADIGYQTRQKIAEETGVPFKNIMISATHTHSAPGTAGDHQGVAEYQQLYFNAAVEAAKAALADRSPASAQSGSTLARTENNKQLVFVRRYKQLGGGYNGGVGHKENAFLISHAYEANETMQIIKFVRAGGKKDILLTNLGAHATFNGATTLTAITADFPGAIRDYVETNSNCLSAHFISGGADQNPTSELTWEEHGLDYVAYGHAVAKAALNTTLTNVATGDVAFASKVVTVASNKGNADAATLAKAEEANAVFLTSGFAAGEAKAIELGFVGIYQARSILSRVNLADTMEIGINALAIGDLSFVFASYELFGGSAADIVAGSPYENTFVISCANGSNGYVPIDAAYDMGCYESYTARTGRGSAETLVNEFKALLNTVR